MELKGQIEEIIYSNEGNGYTVCNLSVEENLVTAVGYLPFTNVGDVIVANGKYITHSTYGQQFKIDTFEKIMPDSIEQIEKYLGSGIIKGVGPVTAGRIVRKFGKDTIYTLRFEPYKLSQIPGISSSRASTISDDFNKEWELWQIVMFLQKYGIGVANANRVYKELGINAIESIKENPYMLLNILYGADFTVVDKIALDLGTDCDSSFRISSAIRYALILASRNGNTCVLEQNLLEYVSNLLGTSFEVISNELTAMNYSKNVYIENDYVFLRQYYVAEENIAKRLLSMCNDTVKKYKSLNEKIDDMEKQIGIKLSKEQKKAVESAFNNRVTIITGGPGTGKTTIIKMMIKLFEKEDLSLALCAPTGRAAKRITETTGEEAKTLHRLLELGKMDDDSLNIDYEVAKIDKDVVIVDEVSMIDTLLMNYLMRGLTEKPRLILIGDSDQLPSVGPGSILKDLINSGAIPTAKLTEIYRQAAESNIVMNAHSINCGEMIDLSKKEGDFFFIKAENTVEQIKDLVGNRLSKFR